MLVSLHLIGDTHNFGRRVRTSGKWVQKPRTLAWERLFLSAKSPLRRLLPLEFLPDLAFRRGAVEKIALDPLPRRFDPIALGRIAGRSVALFSWLGVTDLHWENLVLGMGERGLVFAPIDIEMVLEDFSSPAETRLIPESDPDYMEIYRHACGVRRLLPWLGKPIAPTSLAALIGAYTEMLALLDRNARSVADVFARLRIERIPIRVTLRSTADYVDPSDDTWPPFLDAELEQMDRGDIPYFFRLYGRPGIHWWADRALRTVKTLPLRGDVPRLAPLLSIARGFRSPSRKKLRERGVADLRKAFAPRGSVYLPCRCGEARSVFAAASRCNR